MASIQDLLVDVNFKEYAALYKRGQKEQQSGNLPFALLSYTAYLQGVVSRLQTLDPAGPEYQRVLPVVNSLVTYIEQNNNLFGEDRTNALLAMFRAANAQFDGVLEAWKANALAKTHFLNLSCSKDYYWVLELTGKDLTALPQVAYKPEMVSLRKKVSANLTVEWMRKGFNVAAIGPCPPSIANVGIAAQMEAEFGDLAMGGDVAMGGGGGMGSMGAGQQLQQQQPFLPPASASFPQPTVQQPGQIEQAPPFAPPPPQQHQHQSQQLPIAPPALPLSHTPSPMDFPGGGGGAMATPSSAPHASPMVMDAHHSIAAHSVASSSNSSSSSSGSGSGSGSGSIGVAGGMGGGMYSARPPELDPHIKSALWHAQQAMASLRLHNPGNALLHVGKCCEMVGGMTGRGVITPPLDLASPEAAQRARLWLRLVATSLCESNVGNASEYLAHIGK